MQIVQQAFGRGLVKPGETERAIALAEASGELGIALGTNLVNAGRDLVEVLDAYDLKAEDARHASDVLFNAVQKLGGPEAFPQITFLLGRLAPAADRNKISFDEMATSLALVAGKFNNPRLAMQAFSQIMETLDNRADEFKDKFGVDLPAAIGEGGLAGGLRKIRDKFIEQREAVIASGVTQTEYSAILAILGDDVDGLEVRLANLASEHGKVAQIAKESGDSLVATWEAVGKDIKAVSLDIGTAILPIAKGISTFLKDALTAYKFFVEIQAEKLDEATRRGLAFDKAVTEGAEDLVARTNEILEEDKEKFRVVSKEKAKIDVDTRKFITAATQENIEAQKKLTSETIAAIPPLAKETQLQLDLTEGIRGAALAQAQFNAKRAATNVTLAKAQRANLALAVSEAQAGGDPEKIQKATAALQKNASEITRLTLVEAEQRQKLNQTRIAEEERIFQLQRTLGQKTLQDELARNIAIIQDKKSGIDQINAAEQRAAQIKRQLEEARKGVGRGLVEKAIGELQEEGKELIDQGDILSKTREIVARAGRTNFFGSPEEVREQIALMGQLRDAGLDTIDASQGIREFFEQLQFGPRVFDAVAGRNLQLPETEKVTTKLFGTEEEVKRLVDAQAVIIEGGLVRVQTAYEQFLANIEKRGVPFVFGGASANIERLLADALERELARGGPAL
jgi:hypothetical protein